MPLNKKIYGAWSIKTSEDYRGEKSWIFDAEDNLPF